jgi:hypothetical protein
MVADLKSSDVGFSVIVNALDPTEAVIGCILSLIPPVAESVPVMAAPVAVKASIVVVPDFRSRLPEASPVETNPPPPEVKAAIEAMFYPLGYLALTAITC